MIKYSLWALLFWLGVTFILGIAEYGWISDASGATIKNLWSGWGLVGTIIGGIGLGISLLAGSRGMRIATLAAGAVVIMSLRSMMTFDYPTLFYGPYEIVRWILLLIMIAIFVIPIMWSLISQGSSPS